MRVSLSHIVSGVALIIAANGAYDMLKSRPEYYGSSLLQTSALVALNSALPDYTPTREEVAKKLIPGAAQFWGGIAVLGIAGLRNRIF